MTDSEYFAYPALSQSKLKELQKLLNNDNFENGFALFNWFLKHPKESKVLDFGKLLHCIVLEPQNLNEYYRFYKGNANLKANASRIKQFEDLGYICANINEFIKARNVLDSLKANASIKDIINHNNDFIEFETPIFFEYNGFEFKSKIDINDHVNEIAYDLKTCKDATNKGIYYAVKDFGYHIQKFIYQKAVKSRVGRNYDFKFIFVEKEPPYASRIVNLSEFWNNQAEIEVNELLEIYAEYSVKNLEFTGYSEILI